MCSERVRLISSRLLPARLSKEQPPRRGARGHLPRVFSFAHPFSRTSQRQRACKCLPPPPTLAGSSYHRTTITTKTALATYLPPPPLLTAPALPAVCDYCYLSPIHPSSSFSFDLFSSLTLSHDPPPIPHTSLLLLLILLLDPLSFFQRFRFVCLLALSLVFLSPGLFFGSPLADPLRLPSSSSSVSTQAVPSLPWQTRHSPLLRSIQELHYSIIPTHPR